MPDGGGEPLFAIPRDLTKSLFMAGVQCSKRLWLSLHRPAAAAPPDRIRRAAMAEGHLVGALARRRFPGGRLIAETGRHPASAGRTTRAAIASGAPALYEAAFRSGGVRVRSDLLVRRRDGRFDLLEVKASTRVKAEHELDLAIQLDVARGAGIDVAEGAVLHLDRDYEHRGGELDLERLFVARPLGARSTELLAEVASKRLELAAVAAAPAMPAVAVGEQCWRPRVCPFFAFCHGHPPPMPPAPALADLVGERARAVVREARPPLFFLDFEAWAPAIPRFAATRPYESLPFLWSLLRIGADGGVAHEDFFVAPGADPRPDFAASLLDALGSTGTIFVYSGFERRVLADLGRVLPAHRAALSAASDRVVDLHAHLERRAGGASLKQIARELGIPVAAEAVPSDGAEAAIAYATLVAGGHDAESADRLETGLRDYCRRDVEVLRRLYLRLCAD